MTVLYVKKGVMSAKYKKEAISLVFGVWRMVFGHSGVSDQNARIPNNVRVLTMEIRIICSQQISLLRLIKSLFRCLDSHLKAISQQSAFILACFISFLCLTFRWVSGALNPFCMLELDNQFHRTRST